MMGVFMVLLLLLQLRKTLQSYSSCSSYPNRLIIARNSHYYDSQGNNYTFTSDSNFVGSPEIYHVIVSTPITKTESVCTTGSVIFITNTLAISSVLALDSGRYVTTHWNIKRISTGLIFLPLGGIDDFQNITLTSLKTKPLTCKDIIKPVDTLSINISNSDIYSYSFQVNSIFTYSNMFIINGYLFDETGQQLRPFSVGQPPYNDILAYDGNEFYCTCYTNCNQGFDQGNDDDVNNDGSDQNSIEASLIDQVDVINNSTGVR